MRHYSPCRVVRDLTKVSFVEKGESSYLPIKGVTCGFSRDNAREKALRNIPVPRQEALGKPASFDDRFQRRFFSVRQVHTFLNLHVYIYTTSVDTCQHKKIFCFYLYTYSWISHDYC
jgi:hypothetical protein